MSASYNRLSIIGHDNLPYPNSFIRQEEETSHLAILFPGFSYGPSFPALHYSAVLLSDNGADVLRLERLYADFPGFGDLTDSERARITVADALAACEAGLKQRNYTRITLVGKSIGTLAMARLLRLLPQLQKAECIWLTPILPNDKMRDAVVEKRPRSLFVIGTADDFYKPELLDELEDATGGTSLVLEGANHALEISGSVLGSIKGMERMIAAMAQFLKFAV